MHKRRKRMLVRNEAGFKAAMRMIADKILERLSQDADFAAFCLERLARTANQTAMSVPNDNATAPLVD